MPKTVKQKDALDQIVDQFDLNGATQESLFGPDGLVRTLVARFLNKVLEAEMATHLGYKKYERKPADRKEDGNGRNGYSTKTIMMNDQEVKVKVPRDRKGEFKPEIVKKYEKRSALFNEQILSMYSRGMSTREIQAHLEEIYGTEVSPTLISNVTDAVMEDVREWRSRPLDSMYPVVFLDALRVNSRETGRNENKSLFLVLARNREGIKDVLGMYLQENEGARFWMNVLADLKNRGVQDILIACMDGLTGFPDAVRSVFPDTQVQLCIVHMVRNSTKYVAWKDRKAVCRDLRAIYSAPNEDEALAALDDFGKKWNSKYPKIQESWMRHWDDLNTFFAYPMEVRKMLYTTNAIESLNASLRKVIRNKGSFPDDDSIYKIMYLAIRNMTKKWTRPAPNWAAVMNQFAIMFGDRVKL